MKEAYEDVWTGLETSEQEEILNESIIRPDAILRYEGHVTIRDSSAKHHPKNQAETSAEVCRLSSFGVDKVFPRLKVQSGQKDVTYEDPKSTRAFESGTAKSVTSEKSAEHTILSMLNLLEDPHFIKAVDTFKLLEERSGSGKDQTNGLRSTPDWFPPSKQLVFDYHPKPT